LAGNGKRNVCEKGVCAGKRLKNPEKGTIFSLLDPWKLTIAGLRPLVGGERRKFVNK